MLDHLFEPENKLMMSTLFPLLLLGCILVRRRSAQTQASVGSVTEQAGLDCYVNHALGT